MSDHLTANQPPEAINVSGHQGPPTPWALGSTAAGCAGGSPWSRDLSGSPLEAETPHLAADTHDLPSDSFCTHVTFEIRVVSLRNDLCIPY